ncbi:MAG: ATP-binding cassette domain-containing protein, partial [Firmicutes bacterium]|nr:ATP-binding cassette domain-containing protein [Bacillota bacterium]
KIKEKLLTLEAVGMDYVTLKQTTSSMSGGECQRLKLAAHLKSKEGIYVLDEPAAGLHGKDIALLMKLLDDMVERGNTVIVVEHNPDIICCADWIIDMGPGGGRSGGQVVYEGRQKDSLV